MCEWELVLERAFGHYKNNNVSFCTVLLLYICWPHVREYSQEKYEETKDSFGNEGLATCTPITFEDIVSEDSIDACYQKNLDLMCIIVIWILLTGYIIFFIPPLTCYLHFTKCSDENFRLCHKYLKTSSSLVISLKAFIMPCKPPSWIYVRTYIIIIWFILRVTCRTWNDK